MLNMISQQTDFSSILLSTSCVPTSPEYCAESIQWLYKFSLIQQISNELEKIE